MALRRKPGPLPPACECAERVAELEAAVAALARAAIRNGGGDDAYMLPGNRAINNRPDAAIIREAARQGQR